MRVFFCQNPQIIPISEYYNLKKMGTLYFCIQVSVDNYGSPETNFFTSFFFISDEKFKVKYI